MYAASRGKKLAAPFLRATEKDYRSVTQYDGPIWLSTAIDNIAAQTLYTRTGYHETARDGERLIMIKDAQS